MHLPKLSRYSDAIRDEASQFELKMPEGGSLTFGAEGTSKNDLIMALTYILWFGERNTDRRRLRWI